MKKSNEESGINLEEVKQLIKAKRYGEARSLLEELDANFNNPTVRKWIQKLEAMAVKEAVINEVPAPKVEAPNSSVIILPEKPPREQEDFFTRYRLHITTLVLGIFAFLGSLPK